MSFSTHSVSEVKSLSRVRLFATPWTVAYQAPPPVGFSRQEYWSGLLFPSPGDLPNSGIEPGSPTLQADALPSEPPGILLYNFPFVYYLCLVVISKLILASKKMNQEVFYSISEKDCVELAVNYSLKL